MPNRGMSYRRVEIDLKRKHFYDNDVHYPQDGRLLDRVQFQNDSHSYFYEQNGSSLGKAVIQQSMCRFDDAMGYFVLNLDFMAVRPLLEEVDISTNISLNQHKSPNTITLSHKSSHNKPIDYTFALKPLRLLSVKHRPFDGVFKYKNYQTSRGFTYARTVYQYYGGATEPNYVIYNDQFNIIEQVEPNNLRLPVGYGPILDRGDGVLSAKSIGKDLYLVTDSSAVRNSLFKVNGNKIMLFGAAGYPALARKILALIQQMFPDKTIDSVYVSHSHGHEIAGLGVYAEYGVKILADVYNINAIKAYPDFADDIETFQFQVIQHGQTIAGAQFFVLESLHSKRHGFVHFEALEIIYQSDWLHVPFDNSIAEVIPSYTRTFIDFIRKHQLEFRRIVAGYRNNHISPEVVNKIYTAIM